MMSHATAAYSHADSCIINPRTSPTCLPANKNLICLQSEEEPTEEEKGHLYLCGIRVIESRVLKFTAKGSPLHLSPFLMR